MAFSRSAFCERHIGTQFIHLPVQLGQHQPDPARLPPAGIAGIAAVYRSDLNRLCALSDWKIDKSQLNSFYELLEMNDSRQACLFGSRKLFPSFIHLA